MPQEDAFIFYKCDSQNLQGIKELKDDLVISKKTQSRTHNLKREQF